MSSTVSRDHVLKKSTLGFVIRIIQLAVAIVILGLCAYGVTYIVFDGAALSLFTAIATMILIGYGLLSAIFFPILYNYWAVLGLEIFAIIFWLISFALLGSEVASYTLFSYDYSDCYYYLGYCLKKRDLSGLETRATTNYYTYRNSLAAAAGLGGLQFILFIITLVFLAINIRRHRREGGHCTANHVASVSVTTEAKGDVEMQPPHNGQNVYPPQGPPPAAYQGGPPQQQYHQQQPVGYPQQQGPYPPAAQQ